MQPPESSAPKVVFDLKLVLALVISVLSWASAWVSIRVAVEHFSPGQLALGRYLVASLVLLPIFLVRRPRFQPSDWWLILAAGVSGFTVYNLGINTGERTITAGAAALIGSIIPVLTTLGAQFFLKEKVSRAAWYGSAIALGGVVLIALGEEGGLGLSFGALLVLAAAFGAAIYGLLQKRLLTRYAALDVTSAAIFAGVLTMLPFGSGLVDSVRTASLEANFNLVVLGLFPGSLGYVLWSYCLSRLPVARVMSFLYLVAPLAVLMGWAFLGELPSMAALIGGGITLVGVILSNRKQPLR